MIWIFCSVVLVCMVLHRTFRLVVFGLCCLAALGLAWLFYAEQYVPNAARTARTARTQPATPAPSPAGQATSAAELRDIERLRDLKEQIRQAQLAEEDGQRYRAERLAALYAERDQRIREERARFAAVKARAEAQMMQDSANTR